MTTYLTSILPGMASPCILLGPRGHGDLTAIENDPSVCNFCSLLLKLLNDIQETDSSSKLLQISMDLSVKSVDVDETFICNFNECPRVL